MALVSVAGPELKRCLDALLLDSGVLSRLDEAVVFEQLESVKLLLLINLLPRI